MSHFGILCPTASGHLNPMTTLGHELQSRGHRVTLVGTLDARSKTLAAGLEFYPIGEAEFPLGQSSAALQQLGQLSGFEALRFTVALFRRATVMLLQEAPAAFQSIGVDALLIDQTSFGGTTVAERLDLPFITVCCALMLNRDLDIPPFNTSRRFQPSWWGRLQNRLSYQLLSQVAKPITDVIREYHNQWGLSPFIDPNHAYSRLCQLCQQPPEFEYPRSALPDCFHFTGPYSNPSTREPADFPYEKLTGQPLIYASLGTIQNQVLQVFQLIAEACQGLDAQLVIALGGGLDPKAIPTFPGSPIVVGYAPQLELLKRTQLTITHAGMNTTLESLSQGVPMVAIPIANDQPGVAARIAWTGAGEFISLKQLNVVKLRQLIQQVMTQESYRSNALRLQKAIQKAGGVRRAADLVEKVISTGQPAYRDPD